MTLYNDEILVDCRIVSTTNTTANVRAYTWQINHSWPMWAIEINDKLILN